jgi:hypothetical protein
MCGDYILMDSKQIGKIIAFLGSIPPNTRLRLILQLALTSSIPPEKYEQLLLPMYEGKDLLSLIQKENLLVNLMNADGSLEDLNIEMIDLVTEKLLIALVTEIQEIETYGTLKGSPLLWTETSS